jgi:hypothetical protein
LILRAPATELLYTARSITAEEGLRRYKEIATKRWACRRRSRSGSTPAPNPYLGADRVEGMRGLVEKRAPRWSGR